ncbi:MAG: glutamate mutase L [Bacillota bacterium]|jgi:uncharacterized protein (TIGR01319 family)
MIERILAADVGSTTTKTVLFEKAEDGWRLLGKTVAPTTVEAPDLDVMIGLRNAVAKLEKRVGRRLLDGVRLLTPAREDTGIDVFVATSSAGGGLQMLVTGLINTITAESAYRAALGAGAIVCDVLSLDDNRAIVERIESIKRIRPDMVLVTGGTDGGNISDVAAIAEYLAMANPSPRFGEHFKIPLIYAGNVDARDLVTEVTGEVMDISYTDNIRPVLEKEVLTPAREEIHRLFLEHVMMQAPGYKTLLSWTGGYVKPTPVAVGDTLQSLSETRGHDVLGVDIGGATTDVFSVIDGTFHRTVSANLGMSYSTGNVLMEAGIESVVRWLPWAPDENMVRNWDFNKMIRPTTLPQTLEELILEQAIAREALRLSFEHHRSLTRGLKGVRQERNVGDVFNQTGTGNTLVNRLAIGLMVGSGGVLSYAPRRQQAAMMMIDALEPEGVTDIMVDSQFLLPHLGAIMEADASAAQEILETEALVPLGTVIAPVGPQVAPGIEIAKVEIDGEVHWVVSGELQVVPLSAGQSVTVNVTPKKEFTVGKASGVPVTARAMGGTVGIILDGRGRPIAMPVSEDERISAVRKWLMAMDVYPSAILESFADVLAKEAN